MRKLVDFSLKNPLAIIIIFFSFSLLGFFLSKKLPEDVFPNKVFPRVVVTVSSGYTPMNTMLNSVTIPIENAVKSVEGVKEVRSRTGPGISVIDIYFNWGIDPYRAYQMVLAKISSVEQDFNVKPSIDVRLMSPSAYAIAGYALVSDSAPLYELKNIVDYTIRPKLLSIDGIYKVNVVGGTENAASITLDLSKMQTYGINLDDVLSAIKSALNVRFLGNLRYANKGVLSFYYDNPSNIEDLLSIPINKGNVPIKLSDIATAIYTNYPTLSYVSVDGYKNAVIFNIKRDYSANSVDLVKKVDKKLKEIEPSLPKNVKIIKWFDITSFISISIRSVVDAIIIGSIITLIVIGIFLNSFRLASLTAIVIPVSIFCSLVVIYILHGSLNIMSLGGLAASVGALVDHAIVVMENIERNINTEKPKYEIILNSASTILRPMSVATLSSISIFVPLFFLQDIIGVFFKELAMSVVLTLFISQLSAIFLTPLLAYFAIKKSENNSHKNINEPTWLLKLNEFYSKAFLKIEKKSYLGIIGALSLLVLALFSYKALPTSFLPEWDEGMIVLDFSTKPGSSIEDSYNVAKYIEKILNNIKEIKHYSLRIGAGIGQPRTPSNKGDFLIWLKNDRNKSVFEIMDEIRKEVNTHIHTLIEFDLAQVLHDRLGDITGQHAPFEVIIYGKDPDTLIKIAKDIREKIKQNKLFEEVNLKTLFFGPYLYIKALPNTYKDFGITDKDIENTVRAYLFGIDAGSFLEGEYPVYIRIVLPFEKKYENIENALIYSPKLNSYVKLKDVASLKLIKAVPQITRRNMAQMALVRAKMVKNNYKEGAKAIKEILKSYRFPEGYTYSLTGFYKDQEKSFKNLTRVILFSMVIIFTLLLLQFRSVLQSLAVFIGTSLSISGSLFALLITGKSLDVTAFMGVLLTLSIVINNGILIFDRFNDIKTEIKDDLEALRLAVLERFRPIIMTMVADSFGFLPIAFAIGKGTEIIQNMAIGVMGGLISGIFISLFISPTLFLFIKSFTKKEVK